MAFSFGFGGTPAAAAAPSTGTTLTLTGGAAGGADGGGGGGGLFSTPAPAPTTAAPTNTTTAAVATTSTATSSMPSFGIGIGSVEKSSTATSTATGITNLGNAISRSGNNMDTKIIANIPAYHTLFPNYAIRQRIEGSLARWRSHRSTMSSQIGDHGDERSFAAMELIRLLSVQAGNGQSGGGSKGEEENQPVGRFLANPTPSMVNFFHKAGETVSGDKEMQERLHRALVAGAAATAASSDTSSGIGIGGGASGGGQAGEMSSSAFYITLEHSRTTTSTARTTMPNSSSTTTTAIITPRISSEILQLASELHINDVQALALFAEAQAALSRLQRRRNDYFDDNDDDEYDNSNIGEGGSSENVNMLVRVGQAGYVQSNNGYNDHHDNLKEMNPSSSSPPTSATTSAGSAVRNMAHHLYFRDISSTLTILYDLIQHRVEATTELLEENNGALSNNSNAILIGTDQLLLAGLVPNLIKSVRELTSKIEEISKTLKNKDEEQRVAGGATTTQNISATSSSTLFGGASSLFGGSSNQLGGMISPPESTTDCIIDMEFAFRGFAHTQRQLASECLFLLSYHTQLTVEEVVALIDLIRDLTNGDDSGVSSSSSLSLGEGLPLLDPLLDDVPSPFEVDTSSPTLGVGGLPWQQQQSQSTLYGSSVYRGGGEGGGGGDSIFNQWQPHPISVSPPKLKDAKVWEDELVALLWKRGQPQLLRCVSSLILTVVCALDATHLLVDRISHGPNVFGVGNALLPPSRDHDRGGYDAANATQKLLPIHQRLDPDSGSAAEESWTRRDIWGLLLVPYALLLRNTTAVGQTTTTSSPRATTPRPGTGVIDIKGTYSQCLMVASQLKSLTFARLSLLPSVSSSLVGHGGGGSASIYDFYLSTLSEFTAQYIDALGNTGNLPITRQEWLDEEMNMAQTEWMEKEQRRQFGEWAGEPVPQNDDEDVAEGPRAVNLLDRPDCLEDVFALASNVCEAYPSGARAFWYITENEVGEGDETTSYTVLSPSRALQTLDLLQSENDSSLFVYLSFLSSLALADANKRGSLGGADMIHSYLTGNQTINPHSPGTDRHMHFMWNTIMSSIRWYAEHLTPSEDVVTAASEDSTTKSSAKLRGTNSVIDEASTSYYYGLGGGDSPMNSGGDVFSTSAEPSERNNRPSASLNVINGGSKVKELGEVGRNTLMALLCLVSNVASKCAAARDFILRIQLPALDMNDGGGLGYQDGSLEILFSLLTIASLPPEIMGMTFVAIANLLQPNDDFVGAAPAATSDSSELSAPLSERVGPVSAVRNNSSTAAAMRAWELLELCQFVPIKLLSQYSSYAAGAGSIPRISSSSLGLQKTMQPASGANDKPLNVFPESTDYGMIYQFEHVESKLGQFPATEGFLFLLSTLVKVVGCPTDLGSQWRLRPGCAPYIEYVTDFILPRATGMEKNARPTRFASVSDEYRLVERALEVVEAVIIRYVIPPSPKVVSNMEFKDVKERHVRNVKFAEVDLGLGCIVSEIFHGPDHLSEEETTSAFQDFQDSYFPPQDSASLRDRPEISNQMLEASFGNQVPLPKSPGFVILSNLLSTNGGLLLQIIQTLLVKNGGAKGIHTFNESIHSKSLASSLFRETPPTLECAHESTVVRAREEQNIVTGKSSQETMSSLHQSIILSLNPVLLYTYFDSISTGKAQGASSINAVLWTERVLHLSIRILCAAAAREEAFIESLKESGSVALSVVPTLLFKGPIHGSFAHRFVHKEKVNVSRLSQLLTTRSAHGTNRGMNSSPYILPIITELVGYTAYSLPDSQGIARSSFGIVSYISHNLPHTQSVQSLCGNDDTDGIRLATAFSMGLLSKTSTDTWDSETDTMKDAILDLILSNITCSDSTFNTSSLSFTILGLRGESRHNCLNGILELISEEEFALDPMTSSTATKCFEIVHLVCKLGNAHGIPANVRYQQLLFMEKLRRRKFWLTQITRYLGVQGHSAHSIFHEISNSYSIDHGHDVNISKRNNDVLHSIAYLLQGLAIELHSLVGQHTDRLVSANHHFQSILSCLFSQPNPMLLTTLIDMPLGQSSNEFVRERLHRFAAPSSEAMKMCSRQLSGFVDGCAGYEIIDIESLICHFQSNSPPSSWEDSKEWALTWNNFVHRAYSSSHITEAWTDVVRASLICAPLVTDIPKLQAHSFVNARTVMEILCTILTRMLSPSNFDAVGLYGTILSDEVSVVEAECAMPLSFAALSLVDVVTESSGVNGALAGFNIAEEDVARVFSLIIGSISSCFDSGSGMHISSGSAAILSCALSRILVFSAEAEYSVFSQFTPGTINVCAKAAALLLRLSTSSIIGNWGHSNAHGRAIALAAGSGLSSLFEHMKSNEHLETVSEFCSKIFIWDEIFTAVAQLVRFMNNDDNDVSRLLQQITMFHGGVQLLAKAGVTTELLKFAKEYSLSERAYLSSHFGVSVAAELKPPPLLEGQLSLLNALLASPLATSDRVALAVDSLQLLKIYSATFERVIQLYPTHMNLAMKFIEALQLTYSALDEATELNLLGSTLLNADESLLTLERCVLRLTYQLSASPFPSHLLPPLPIGLINVEKIHAMQVKNVSINRVNESTWWDNIPANKDDQPMQVPPTGSSSVIAHPKFASYLFDSQTQWSERKYQYAISTGKCLDLSILFLTTWINIVSKRGAPTFSIDAVAIAKGICRCSDASRAIHDYLKTLEAHPEEDVTKMLHVSHVTNESQRVRHLSGVLKREREYLSQLGEILGRCAEKLVCLALQDARRIALRPSSSITPESTYQRAYFVGAFTPTLDHTEIESKGVGSACGDAEGSMAIAQALRQALRQ